MAETREVECPRCGCGTRDLKPEALPVEVRRMGDVRQMRCRICGKEWLDKSEEVRAHA